MHRDSVTPAGDDVRPRAATSRRFQSHWKRGVIPYAFDASLSNGERDKVEDAITIFNATTEVSFRPRNGEAGYVRIVKPSDSGECSSFVGAVSSTSAQDLKLGSNCYSQGTILHELAHAAGLWHEQSRTDRDLWVSINSANIETGKEGNFAQYSTSRGADYGPYDYGSQMHYRVNAFSNGGGNTITPLQAVPGGAGSIGNGSDLSGTDERGLWAMYGTQTDDVEIVWGTGKCWDVAWGSAANQAQLQVFNCHDGANQRWTIQPNGDGTVEIRNKNSNKCLDYPVGGGGYLQQFDCHGGTNQRWRLYRQGDLMSIRRASNTSQCIDVTYDNRLKLGSCAYPPSYRFYVRPEANRTYQLRQDVVHSFAFGSWTEEKCVDIPWASHLEGADLQRYPCKHHSADNQGWRFEPTGVARHYLVRSAESGLCIDGADSNRLEQRACDQNRPSQRWLMPLAATGATQFVPDNAWNYTTCMDVAHHNNAGENWLAAQSACTSGNTDTYFWVE
jgi:hypothetical protein